MNHTLPATTDLHDQIVTLRGALEDLLDAPPPTDLDSAYERQEWRDARAGARQALDNTEGSS